MANGARLRRGIRELAPDETHVVGFHHDHELGMDEVDPVHLAAAVPAEVGVGQLGESGQRRARPQAHRLPVNGVGARGHDVQRFAGASVARGRRT